MRIAAALYALCLGFLCLLPLAAQANLPRRDLLVELRQVVEGQEGTEGSGAFSVSTLPAAEGFVPQQVRVQNGEKAQLRISQSMSLQWVQSAGSQSTTLVAGAASATQHSGSVNQATAPLEAGQTLVVTPRWAGGSRPVQLVLDLQTAAVAERTGAELPTTSRQQVMTTLSVNLRQWVTVATSGATPSSGSYSSAGANGPRRLIQIRVTPQ